MDIVSYSISKEHDKIYQKWFSFADSVLLTVLLRISPFIMIDGDGRLSGTDAIKFFAMSNLPRGDLKQVWAIADSRREGYLGFKEFVIAMKLVSLAQEGNEITQFALADADLEEVHPPVMEGLDTFLSTNKPPIMEIDPEQNVNSQPQTPKVQWFGTKSAKKIPLSSVTSIIDGLKRLYIQKLKPLEVAYQFSEFGSSLLTSSDFDAKPMVMLLGQYSTGKTTFIKHLLKCSYPGAHIGPEPTTDRFVVVMLGSDERTIPGNTIAVQADMPFTGLTTFGNAFLSKFECSQMPHSLLEHITFVDTPGVLSGEKQRTQRSYDFTGVTSWFAAKSDLILLLFDPHKLDISDEFKRVIGSLRGHDDKIRVVLNKADQIDTQQLMRVYGALTWSLGKVLNTPEVMRVYIGSFNDKPVNNIAVGPVGKELFEREQNDLLSDLKDIPKKACDRKINEFVKRARAAKIHAYIISHLRSQMPSMLGKAKAQQRLINNLENEFAKVQRDYHLPPGDFPDVQHFKEVLSGYNIDNLPRLKTEIHVKAVPYFPVCIDACHHRRRAFCSDHRHRRASIPPLLIRFFLFLLPPPSSPSSSASSSSSSAVDLVGYMEDKAAASPCDLPTTVLGLRPSPASSSSMHRLLHVLVKSREGSSFGFFLNEGTASFTWWSSWKRLCWGEIAQFSNFMVLRPLVMVLILKISPSSTSFPACVASHGGRGSNGSSSNTVLNAAMATCDIHHDDVLNS
ncbi:Dynamin family [Musa troglodytarum]|uniref:Dynamin family n=1 Tax=Musa troglodytarum TaxID=320322 RepID=A0A9E7FXM5_9LILI|nr:Dynamin family [Musa troglodytarum]